MLVKDDAGKKTDQYDSETDARKVSYFDEKIGFYLPSSHFEASMREAAKNFKKGKSNYKLIIMAGAFIGQDRIPLNRDAWDEIDRRLVVIQRNRVVKSRPRFNEWEAEFVVEYDAERIKPETLKNILIEAGSTKAVGDYRPKFGRFEVKEFEELEV